MDDPKAYNKETLLFSMSEEVGALARALKIFEVANNTRYKRNGRFDKRKRWLFFSLSLCLCCFPLGIVIYKDHKVNLLHIESRSSKRSIGDYEFIVEIDTVSGDVNGAIEGLRKQSSYFQIISRDHKDTNG